MASLNGSGGRVPTSTMTKESMTKESLVLDRSSVFALLKPSAVDGRLSKTALDMNGRLRAFPLLRLGTSYR